jgi:hypothetical protein
MVKNPHATPKKLPSLAFIYHQTPEQIQRVFDAAASMRIIFFRGFPYLYAGKFSAESEYFSLFLTDPQALVLTVGQLSDIVGICTGINFSLAHHLFGDCFNQLTKLNYPTSQLFYLGELIIRPEFQRKGLAGAIFTIMEKFAKSKGFKGTTFCTKVPLATHPLRPLDYDEENLHQAYQRYGYVKTSCIVEVPYLTITNINQDSQVENHQLVFWVKIFS